MSFKIKIQKYLLISYFSRFFSPYFFIYLFALQLKGGKKLYFCVYFYCPSKISYKSQILICYGNVVPVKKKKKYLRARQTIISYVSKKEKGKKWNKRLKNYILSIIFKCAGRYQFLRREWQRGGYLRGGGGNINYAVVLDVS